MVVFTSFRGKGDFGSTVDGVLTETCAKKSKSLSFFRIPWRRNGGSGCSRSCKAWAPAESKKLRITRSEVFEQKNAGAREPRVPDGQQGWLDRKPPATGERTRVYYRVSMTCGMYQVRKLNE
jgi:hypothetical protein